MAQVLQDCQAAVLHSGVGMAAKAWLEDDVICRRFQGDGRITVLNDLLPGHELDAGASAADSSACHAWFFVHSNGFSNPGQIVMNIVCLDHVSVGTQQVKAHPCPCTYACMQA